MAEYERIKPRRTTSSTPCRKDLQYVFSNPDVLEKRGAYGAYKLANDTKPDAAQMEMLKRYVALERKILAEDIINGKPTIILIEGNRAFPWKDWAGEDPEISSSLQGYRTAFVSDWVTILHKR